MSIYEWNIDDLRARIGYITYELTVFTGTVDMDVGMVQRQIKILPLKM